MTDHPNSRRQFIKGTIAGGASFLAGNLASAAPGGEPSLTPKSAPLLPTRPLGKTGVQVPILNVGGAMKAHTPEFLEQVWDAGIRWFDTARLYVNNTGNGRSEENIADFFAKYPERRKEIFLVTKEHFPGKPLSHLLTNIDERLKKCGTDYIDLFYLHAMDPHYNNGDPAAFLKSDELKRIADTLKASGKIRHIGFTSHHSQRASLLRAAAEGGVIEAAMVSWSPYITKQDNISYPSTELDEALTQCHEAGIGLVAMKVHRSLPNLPLRLPEFDELGLTTHQALLYAVWSDPRFSSICSQMEDAEMIRQNTEAARNYNGPLPEAAYRKLAEVAIASAPSFCPQCDGRCERAACSSLPLADVARHVHYYEREGRMEARELYQSLGIRPGDWENADLAAAQAACHCNLDFTRIGAQARYYFEGGDGRA